MGKWPLRDDRTATKNGRDRGRPRNYFLCRRQNTNKLWALRVGANTHRHTIWPGGLQRHYLRGPCSTELARGSGIMAAGSFPPAGRAGPAAFAVEATKTNRVSALASSSIEGVRCLIGTFVLSLSLSPGYGCAIGSQAPDGLPCALWCTIGYCLCQVTTRKEEPATSWPDLRRGRPGRAVRMHHQVLPDGCWLTSRV